MNILPKPFFIGCWPRWRLARAPAGLTLVEMMVVLGIVAVLAALAAPSFKPLIDRWRVRHVSEAMISSLYLARSEAIKRGGHVVLERNPLVADCSYANRDGAKFWSCGWVIYFDADGNHLLDDGQKIQSISALKNINVSASFNDEQIVFDQWGQPASLGMGGMSFAIYPEPDGNTSPAALKLCLTSGGRIKSVAGNKCS